ncbi:sigma 54-interacting transcriptional regulator [Marasmitruncus massiliensis]|uniref:sigma 54-interacting transcriptional regulator n=1 Tax=Marasmitruncus massiliensis TaxID=1944642 RepID=UPI000C79973E|nr:sigma 54-interacting transcriptional regulator [Marasmitruncus massiliensis]
MLNKILFVATYTEMSEIAHLVAEQRGENMEIVSGELYEAVRRIEQCDLSNKEVIICRGGTARLLRKSFKLPVVEVEVCAYDILRAVYKYKNNRIAVIGAENVISGVKIIEEIMGLDICYFPFTFEHEIEEKIDNIRGMDIDVVVGDTVAVRVAKRKGLAVELIKSGIESVEEGIDKAEKICSAILHEREKNSRINAILEHLNEGIIVTDEHSRIVMFNRIAESLLQRSTQDVMRAHLNTILPDIDIQSVLSGGRSISKQIVRVQGTMIVANTVPIIVEEKCKGVAITCEDVTKIQELEQKIRQTLSKRGLVAKHRFDDILGNSETIRDAINLSKKYARVDITVLIYGESGTGKELFAQSIHNHSERKNGPFIAINCATLPPSLLESTLFGYDEGAFTGAKKGGRKGMFELAHNGTLFLDEITEMDMSIQSKILRVLQEREVMRLGGDSIVPVNVRIIAASNKKLFHAVDANLFREDLYYRISVLNINIPPLRERRDDISLLIRHFAKKCCRKYCLPPLQMEDNVMRHLCGYDWPGNVRQLENAVQKMVLSSENGIFREKDIAHLQLEMRDKETADDSLPLEGTLEEISRSVILAVLKEEGYNKTKTAHRLGITRVTLNKHLSVCDMEMDK